MRRALWIIAAAGFTALTLWLSFRNVEWADIGNAFGGANYVWVAAAVANSLVTVYVLGFSRPLGYFFTLSNVDGDDSDSDVPSGFAYEGMTPSFSYTPTGLPVMNMDAGLVRTTPSLSLTKLAGSAPEGGILYVTNGASVTYTYIFTNTGNSYFSLIQINDNRYDEPIAFIIKPECVAPGETRTYTLTTNINESVTNVATIFGVPSEFKCPDLTGFDPVETNNDAVVIVAAPGYTLDKEWTSALGSLGDPVVFRVRVTNTGNLPLVTVPVEDTYDTNYLTYVSSAPASDDNDNDGVLNWADLGPLPEGSSTSIVLNFTGKRWTPNPPDLSKTNVVVAAPTTPPGAPMVLSQTAEEPYAVAVPTPVELVSLTARRAAGGVRVEWRTAVELRNLGFHVYRSAAVDGARVRLNPDLIEGLGTSEGRAYEFLDRGADPSATLYYWLEDVSWDFETELHGPAVVYGAEPNRDDGPALGAFTVGAQAGLYRIRYETLKTAGVAIDSIDPSTLKVLVNGEETALFVTAWRGPMKAGDYILFYATASAEEQTVELRTGADALRMEEVYAGPVDDEGSVWYGVADEAGTLSFGTVVGVVRYLLVGFPDEQVEILNVTEASRPRLLYGYSWLQVNGQAGVYLGYEGSPARFFAVSSSAVIEVESVTTP